MLLSQLIRQYVDLKIEGEPESSNWRSLDISSKMKSDYHESLQQLEQQIDVLVQMILNRFP